MKWWTSDLHLKHKNIIEYCNRPFRTLDGHPDTTKMDRDLAITWDAMVKPGDEVYVLGDLSFDYEHAYQWIKQRPGQKFLVWGNHDPSARKAKERAHLSQAFVKTGDILETKVGDQLIVMCHYPMLRWNRAHFGSWMLHGHTHGECRYPEGMKIADVGVDAWNMQPVNFDTLKKHMDALPSVKHHYYREL